MTTEMMMKTMMLSGRRVMLMMLTVMATSLRAVRAGYHVELPIDTPAGAAVTAVIVTLVVVSVLSYFYNNFKEQASGAAGQSVSSLTPRCRVLPPREFNGVIPEPLRFL